MQVLAASFRCITPSARRAIHVELCDICREEVHLLLFKKSKGLEHNPQIVTSPLNKKRSHFLLNPLKVLTKVFYLKKVLACPSLSIAPPCCTSAPQNCLYILLLMELQSENPKINLSFTSLGYDQTWASVKQSPVQLKFVSEKEAKITILIAEFTCCHIEICSNNTVSLQG